MKVKIELILDGNLRLPVVQEVNTVADVGRLGRKLTDLPRNVKRTFPDLVNVAIKSVKLSAE